MPGGLPSRLEVPSADLGGVVLRHRIAEGKTGCLLVVSHNVRDAEGVAADLGAISQGPLAVQRRARPKQHRRTHQRSHRRSAQAIAHFR